MLKSLVPEKYGRKSFWYIVGVSVLVAIVLAGLFSAARSYSMITAPTPKVILTFDDSAQGYADDASASLMWTYGYRGVAYFQVNTVTWQNVETWQTLLLRRWEFGSHTTNHLRLDKVSAAQLAYEVSQSKRWIEQIFNTRVVSFAYPECAGSTNATVLQALTSAGYVYARAGGADNWQGQPSLRINCYDFSHDTYNATATQLVNAAKTYGISVAMFHRVNAGLQGWHALAPIDFRYVLDTIRNAGLDVCTFKDLL